MFNKGHFRPTRIEHFLSVVDADVLGLIEYLLAGHGQCLKEETAGHEPGDDVESEQRIAQVIE
ncbi:MAG: hypothetical protein ACOC0U_05975, partial [Desulfovibrionales bacterium]